MNLPWIVGTAVYPTIPAHFGGHFGPPINEGWLCPRCKASNAPSVVQCPCSLNDASIRPDFGKPYGDKQMVPRAALCPCNKANGGSGICGCVNGNEFVEDTR